SWLGAHPRTRVLALATGYRRDYGPGVAYRAYFASPDLMFPAGIHDRRRAAKDRVFGIRVPGGIKASPLDIFADGRIVHDRVGFSNVVLIGEPDGTGVRAYEAADRRFARGAASDELMSANEVWRMTEAALVGPRGASLARLPGHVAYWFAWS